MNINKFLRIFYILAILLFFQQNVFAAGGDCTNAQAQSLTGTDNLVTFNAPLGNIITEVCVKAATTHLRFSSNSSNGCYTVSGIGSGRVTIERTGPESNSCQEISHADVYYGPSQPATSASPTPAPSVSPQASASPQSSASPTPAPSLNPSSGPSSSPAASTVPANSSQNTASSPTPSPSAASSPSPTPAQAQSGASTPAPSAAANQLSSNTSSNTSSSNSNPAGNVNPTPSPTPAPAAISRVLGVMAQTMPETGVELAGVIISLASLAGGTGLIIWKNRRNKL